MIKQQGRLLHKDKEFTSSAILKKKDRKYLNWAGLALILEIGNRTVRLPFLWLL